MQSANLTLYLFVMKSKKNIVTINKNHLTSNSSREHRKQIYELGK
jgi:homoserine dehydrogenase